MVGWAPQPRMRHLDPGGYLGQSDHGLTVSRLPLVALSQNETQKSFGQHRGEW
jgi:hypothetical protein